MCPKPMEHLRSLGVALLIAMASCASSPDQEMARSGPGGLGSNLGGYGPPRQSAGRHAEPVDPGHPTGAITLRNALSLALLRSPQLASFSWELRAREARILQAGLLPNPELGFALEEFAGSGERRGLETAQSTLQLSQLILLGGKRAKRVRTASLELDLAGWDYEAKRLDVLTEVAKSFVEVLAAQEQVTLSKELVEVARNVLETASERVKAGKVSPLEETKASVELTNTRIELEKAEQGLSAARKRLSTLWGQTAATYDRTEGRLDHIPAIPSSEQIERLIAQNPDVARWLKEMEQRSAALELEKAKAIPDVTISAGWQRFNDTRDNAAIVGISIPLPLFDRNQGGILEAKRKEAKAREESRAAELKAHASLADAYHALASSFSTAMALREKALPAAQLAFETAQEGYREGKFSFLEVLDAERTLFETRGKYIEALSGYHKARAEVERLIGERLDAVQ